MTYDFHDGELSDPNAGRDALIAELQSRWVGPRGGPAETLDRSPIYTYLVGVLFPVERQDSSINAAEALTLDLAEGMSGGIEPEELDLLDSNLDPSGDEDEEDPGLNITGAFGWAPNAIGTSFVHSSRTLTIELSAGTYDESIEAGSWTRSERQQTVLVDTQSSSSSLSVLSGRARLSWRSRSYRGQQLTTVSVSNNADVERGEAKRHPEKCLFQVALVCHDESGFLPYPQAEIFVSDEDRELALRYRNRPAYAIGHGASVSWAPAEHPTQVSTSSMPIVDVPPVRARQGTSHVYSMAWLADSARTPEELADALHSVILDYGDWITHQQLASEQVAEQFREDAQRIISRQHTALRRISQGIKLLTTDGTVREAFQLANTAMRWQMLRQRDLIDPSTPLTTLTSLTLGDKEPQWRPFQLAFILSSLASTVDETHPDRELVDLIWFPTGGGKTEAYLGLAAIEMLRRRLVHGKKGGGLAVLTRYTMRLLTAQQFQRSAVLICALERLRESAPSLRSTPAFSIGLWLGNRTTPGTFLEAEKQFKGMQRESRPENPFQLLNCPWCRESLTPEHRTRDANRYGMRASRYAFEFFCPNDTCPFHRELPVQVVDEGIYASPPTMLVATVDKLARLAWISEGSKLFATNGPQLQPSLVIQDELHLLSGPLGTIVGIYEAAIQGLLAWRGTPPKIVASTATTRASEAQVSGLFARPVASFPPAGIDAEDNFFSEPDPTAPGRRYVGIMPQAHTQAWATGQVSAELLDAPRAAHLAGRARDAYWTLVVYHNSLRELGRTVTILRDDVTAALKQRKLAEGDARDIRDDGVEELNGNVNSTDLTALLDRLETPESQPGAIDAIATTNIMSVGVDVSRLGLMLVNGHTKTTSEYIQATSRVGRGATPGLVVTMYRAGKPRDRSVFESFESFHTAFYQFVEPSSVTPWSPQARRRAIAAALVILVRHGVGLADNPEARYFAPDSRGVQKAVSFLKRHVSIADPREAPTVHSEIDDCVREWSDLRQAAEADGEKLSYTSRDNASPRLLRGFTESGRGWPVMNSMRNVDQVVKVIAQGER